MRIHYEHGLEDLVRRRYSCRTYSDENLDPAFERALQRAASRMGLGLLGEKVFFQILSRPAAADRKFAGYGLIKGARSFIVGRIARSERARESYGYLLEHLVLKAADLGLDTVWVGYFRPEYFEEIRLEENEIFPAAVVVGRAAQRKRIQDHVVRAYVKAYARRPWPQLFFNGDFRRPLSEAEAGPYALPLRLVRLAPSSGNTQPWRVVKENSGPIFHFFMQAVKKSYTLKGLHEVDIGIGMAHFELAARQAGLGGEWKIIRPEVSPLPSGASYRWTWIGREREIKHQR